MDGRWASLPKNPYPSWFKHHRQREAHRVPEPSPRECPKNVPMGYLKIESLEGNGQIRSLASLQEEHRKLFLHACWAFEFLVSA